MNKSLVIAERVLGEDTRYRLLETIREYALARLMESGETEAIHRQHFNFFLALAEEAEPRLSSAEQTVWLKKRLGAEHDNFRSALAWAFESAPDTWLRLAGALFWFWYFGGYISEAREWFERAAILMSSAGHTKGRAKALHAAGFFARAHGDYAAARSLLEESVAIWRGLEAGRGLALSLASLGRAALAQGDPVAARSHLEESVPIFREVGDRWGLGMSLMWLGNAASAQGDDVGARSLYTESIATLRELGDKKCIPVPLGYMGYLARRRGDYAAARSFLEESLTLWREAPEPWSIAWALEGLAGVIVAQGQAEQAARLFGAVEAMLEAIGARLDAFDRADCDRNVATVRAQLGEAGFAAAWAEGRAITANGWEQAIAYALEESV